MKVYQTGPGSDAPLLQDDSVEFFTTYFTTKISLITALDQPHRCAWTKTYKKLNAVVPPDVKRNDCTINLNCFNEDGSRLPRCTKRTDAVDFNDLNISSLY